MDYKPTLCLDFDGVLHSYTTPWEGASFIADPPVPGAREFVLQALPHFEVVVFSSRSHQSGGINAMQRWLDKYEFPLVKFPTIKPAAFLTIDDRALNFDGTWPDVSKLLEFKPWNKK